MPTDPKPEPTPAAPAAATPARYLVLVPVGEEWHVVTNGGRLVTTTQRTQVPLGQIEGKRAPFIGADAIAGLPAIDLTELLLGQVAPATAPAVK